MPGIPEYFEGGDELEAAVLGFADGGAAHLDQADANAHFKELQFRVTLVLALQHCSCGGYTTPDIPVMMGLEPESCALYPHSHHCTVWTSQTWYPTTSLSHPMWADIKHSANMLCLKMKGEFCPLPPKPGHSNPSVLGI